MKRAEINSILASAGLRPQHKFGQNFMVDEKTLAAIADAGEIEPCDIVLEVGPGVGNLTRLISQKAAAVLAVDIDKKLLPAAQRHHAELANVTWMIADVLAGKHEINPEVIAALRSLSAAHRQGKLRLVSNLPYNAASPLIAEILVSMWREQNLKIQYPLAFKQLAFTVQWEVAQRLAAKQGCADYGPLTVIVQAMADVKIVRKIPPGAFWPPPKIHSGLVVVRPSVEKIRRIGDAFGLQKMIAGIFSHRRQTLHNALRHYFEEKYDDAAREKIIAAGIDVTLRPEAIAVEQFLALFNLVCG
jgi:16S rRNA (adenine1518-N6/adenine1519-N6)-dimethyltransferase